MKSMYCKLPSGANFKAKVRDNSTIRTVREELSKQIKIPESYINLNISHRIRNLQNPTPIKSLGINPSDNIDVSFIPPRLSFQYGKTAPFSLPFQINSTIVVAKKMLAPRFHVAPETIKLFLYNIELSDKQLLRDLRIPINRHIQIVIEKPKSKSALLFMMQHEAYRLEFPDETTVAQIKDELMRHADKATISIKLLYNGLYLDDSAVLKDLNINSKQCIIVESEMLEREDFILENNSFDDDENLESLLDNKTHAARARTAIIKRRREMRQLSKQSNSNLTSSQKVPIVQPDFSKTAPNSQRIRKNAKSNRENLSKTISGSLANSQELTEIEEEEEDDTLTESQSLGKFTEDQSAEKLTENQSLEKVGSNLLNNSIAKLTDDHIIVEEEEEVDDDAESSNVSKLTNLAGSLEKIAQSGSGGVVSRGLINAPVDSVPEEDVQNEAGQPATLEDSIPVDDKDAEANEPVTLEDSIPVNDQNEEANEPATLEDSIPVESSQSGSNLPNILSNVADNLAKSGSEGADEQNAGPVTLEDSIPVNDQSEEANEPATLEDSIPVNDQNEEANEPATLEDSIPVNDQNEEANEPATLEDSIPVESSQSGSNLPNILSNVAGNLAKSGSEGADEQNAGPVTLEDSIPVDSVPEEDVQNEAGQPATLEDSIPVDDKDAEANEPVTLEDNQNEESGQPATLEDSIPVDSVPEEDVQNEAGQPATLEDSIPVDDKDAEANEPVTLEDSIPVNDQNEEANEPATLEDSIPVESSQSGSNLPNILSNVADNLAKSGSEEKVEDFNEPSTTQDDEGEQQQKVEDFNDKPSAVTREITLNEPATLEETAPEENEQKEGGGSGLSNLLSGMASGLTNADDAETENKPLELAEADEGEDEANVPTTLEETAPVNDEQNQEEAASNEPVTLEETAPVETREVNLNNEETNEAETEGQNGSVLSQLVNGMTQNLTEKTNDDDENVEQNEETNDEGGPDLSQIITGNASNLTGNNNEEGCDDQPDKKGPLDLTNMVNSLL